MMCVTSVQKLAAFLQLALCLLQANLVASALKGKFPHRKLSSAEEVLCSSSTFYQCHSSQAYAISFLLMPKPFSGTLGSHRV